MLQRYKDPGQVRPVLFALHEIERLFEEFGAAGDVSSSLHPYQWKFLIPYFYRLRVIEQGLSVLLGEDEALGGVVEVAREEVFGAHYG